MANKILAVWRCWIGATLVLLLLLGPCAPALAGPGRAALSQGWRAQGAYPDLDHHDPDVRAAAVQAIRQARANAAAAVLVKHLEDPDQRVGIYIVQAVVELAPANLLPVIRNAAWLMNADGRWRAAMILGERKDLQAVPVLTYNLRHPEVLVHSTSADSLAQIGTPAAMNALIRALGSARPSEVNAAMRGLLALGDVAVPALAAVLEAGDPAGELRAATVLEMLGTPAALQALRPLTP
jgi:HEAT repeat protein